MASEASVASVESSAAPIQSAQVKQVSADAVLLELDDGTPASLFESELPATGLEAGAQIDVYVDDRQDAEGRKRVSKTMAEKLRLWDRLAAAVDTDDVFEGEIVAPVKGGVAVDMGVKAFLPASQAALHSVPDLNVLVGETVQVNVIKFNKKRGNLVVSRRKILEAERAKQREVTLRTLTEGEIVDGVVQRFTKFGAFVDVGGLDGLLHTNDMSWSRVDRPQDLFSVGQQIRVKVLELDRQGPKLSLGTKQLTEDPWQRLADTYPEGSKTRGQVVGVADFGAFVEIEPGVEGLVHVSEMSWTKRNQSPKKLVRVGDTVDVVILGIDLAGRRLSLGMKQATENPWRAFAERHPTGSRTEGKVTSLTDFGIFLEVEPGFQGLVHVSDFSWTERVREPAALYKKGDSVEAVVLDVDIDSQRLKLGIKQLTDDPWAALSERHPRGSLVTGKVVRLADFGAFIEIEPGITGLCHISQLAEERVDKVQDAVSEGAEVEAMVLEVDRRGRKVSLSIKAALQGGTDYRAYLTDSDAAGEGFSNSLGAALRDKLPKTDEPTT